ncbi:glycosyltransferase family 4 protein [Aurantiacibacter spongiae]|uniref:Glycosyltransferase family 1 protein n=1 Tax=Aurantiacibacter spongiae TaxID=2488860 RepID=A0A3N5DHN0_9SPHN|nr:glycosyltransferase family 4 protein [Aurantiacibacter spongiae]RPF71172.1 glycosyltransferase family 1 protein [Aurantiacibacter spongiae]
MRILVLSSLSMSLVNFRGALLCAMRDAGHDVIACAPDAEPGVVGQLEEWGIGFRLTPMARASLAPLEDLRTLAAYRRLISAERIDMVVAYTQKPIVFGGLAARMARVPFYAIMSGLGYVFSPVADDKRMLRRLVARVYRAGVARARAIFVFNSDDRRMMLEEGIVDEGQRVLQVPGSGVDTARFAQAPLPEGPPTFLMVGRLMRDKGVHEYIAAARAISADRPDARFLLLGRPEPANPTGLSPEDLARLRAEGIVTLLDEVRDVRPVLARSHVFVLPSFYREGLPRTILEALATGRPVITTDMPGCRDAIEPGENGLLVPPRDARALERAMQTLMDDPARVARMGDAARRTAVERYDVAIVNALLLREMGLVANGKTGQRAAGERVAA